MKEILEELFAVAAVHSKDKNQVGKGEWAGTPTVWEWAGQLKQG